MITYINVKHETGTFVVKVTVLGHLIYMAIKI